jgi:hypothetical protein
MITNAKVKDWERKVCNKSLQTLLIEYYKKIHGEGKFPVEEIRHFLQKCTINNYNHYEGYWTDRQLDNNEFLQTILDQFNFEEVNKNNGFESFENQFYSNPLDEKNPYKSLNKKIDKKTGYDAEYPNFSWYLETNKLNILENNNGFIIKGYDEKLTQKNFAKITYDDKVYMYQTRCVDHVYNNPNMFVIYLIRTSGGDKKNKNSVEIPNKIGKLTLYSIIVHHGKTVQSGHYTCYFKKDHKWYEMDNADYNIKEIKNTPINNDYIKRNCHTLVYFPEETESKGDDSGRRHAGGGAGGSY